MSIDDIRNILVSFLTSRFELPFGKDPGLDLDTPLYDCGYIDSMDSLVLLAYIEKTFSMKISTKELIESPMNSVNEMAELIAGKLGIK
ncbi:MAG: acyl carrier protein [Defluviitaleaceae bacterium]|nr:acyl carrier protein [Defluviitaleaceae bacterium]